MKKSCLSILLISLTLSMLATSISKFAAKANPNQACSYVASASLQTVKSGNSGNPMVFPLLLLAALIILAAGIAIIFYTRRKSQHL